MSISSLLNRWLNRLYKTLAILLVLIAVMTSAFRLFLPYAHNYRQNVQDYINTEHQVNIVIGALSMNWQGVGPQLTASNVQLFDGDNVKASIDRLTIEVDIWNSVTEQRLIYRNLVLEGAHLDIEQKLWQLNQTTVPTPENDKKGSQKTNFNVISSVFLEQIKYFSLQNSTVIIRNEEFERTFNIADLNWVNDGDKHQAQGSIVVDGVSPTNILLRAEINGGHYKNLSGQLYLQANHLDVTPWLKQYLAMGKNKVTSDINFAAWIDIQNSNVEQLQLKLLDNKIMWQKEKPQQISLSEGQLLITKDQKSNTFELYTTPLFFQFNQNDVQEFIVHASRSQEKLSAFISSVDLNIVSRLLPILRIEGLNSQFVTDLSLTGKLQNIFIRHISDNTQAIASFSNLSLNYSHGIPGVENLSGQLSYNQKNLNIDIEGQQGALDFKEHFIQPIPFQSLSANVNILFEPEKLSFTVNDFNFNSDELLMQADINVDIPANKEASMAMLASITSIDARSLGHYYPLTLMSKNLVNYLNDAIIDGNISQAQILYNGAFAHFPFDNNEGIFVVDAELRNSTFKFEKNWPEINDFSANLNFTNNSMTITGRQGYLSGLSVKGVKASISDLSDDQVLIVDTLILPSPADYIADLMMNSPLKNSVGSVLEQLVIGGDIRGEFYLNVPLNDSGNTVAIGSISFDNNQLALQQPRMDFTQLNGSLSFNNEVITTKELSATWLGLPLKLDINGSDKNNYYHTDIVIDADWQEKDWQQHTPLLLKKYVQGNFIWQGNLALYQHHNGGFSYELAINSDLNTNQLNLPEPYTKSMKENMPFIVNVNGQTEQSTIDVTIGNNLSFFGVLNHKNTNFTRAHLVLGDEEMLLPMDGFHITTKLEQASFSSWQPLVSDIVYSFTQEKNEKVDAKALNTKQTMLFAKPDRIRGSITSLDIFGQYLNNVSFNLLNQENWWLLQLNAKETRSQIKIYPDWLVQGLEIDADFIHLAQGDIAEKEEETQEKTKVPDNNDRPTPIDFAQIPNVKFHCERCQIGKLNLGEVNFAVEHTNENTIEIKNFAAKREQGHLNLSGKWLQNKSDSITSVEGDFALKDIEYELEQLGFGSIIRDSGGKVDFSLDWQGAPHEFSFAQLNGNIKAKIDDGYLSEVSDKARIFSILSLQSLVRKLTLDFRDIFSDGMFYSNIKGDYHIENGIVYTKNTKMDGTAGNLYIKGNTDLTLGQLDYKMSYKPNLTSSLPVLAWIATLNPVTFLASVALDNVITSKVVSELDFELTGSIENPNFKEVNRKSRDITVGRSTPPRFVDASEQIKNKNVNSLHELPKDGQKSIPNKNKVLEPPTQLEQPEIINDSD